MFMAESMRSVLTQKESLLLLLLQVCFVWRWGKDSSQGGLPRASGLAEVGLVITVVAGRRLLLVG